MTAARLRAVLLAALVPLAAAHLAPIQDETYYWAWSRAPGLGYVDHPPGVAWILALSTALLGDGLLGLRVPTLAAMGLTLWAAVAAARRLAPPEHRDGAGRLAALLLVGAPMFTVGYLPATPDPFQGAAAAVAAYTIVRAFEDGASPGWAAASGFLLVASTLLKHSSALLAAGALAGVLGSARGRRLLAKAAPWVGAGLGFAAIAPWLATDVASVHGSVAFQATRVFTRGSPRGIVAIPLLIGGTAVALGPATGPVLFFVGAQTMFRPLARMFRSRSLEATPAPRVGTGSAPARDALFTGAAVLLLACLAPVWLGGGELNWSMPALAFAAPALAARAASWPARLSRPFEVAASLAGLALAAVLLHVAHPFLPLEPRRDTTLRGAGFADVAREAELLAAEHGARALITRRYQLASQLRYHTRDRLPVFELGTERASQYDAWPRPSLCSGDVAIVVLPDHALPEALAATLLAAPRVVSRRAGAYALDDLVLTPVRIAADVVAGDPGCRQRRLAVGGRP